MNKVLVIVCHDLASFQIRFKIVTHTMTENVCIHTLFNEDSDEGLCSNI